MPPAPSLLRGFSCTRILIYQRIEQIPLIMPPHEVSTQQLVKGNCHRFLTRPTLPHRQPLTNPRPRKWDGEHCFTIPCLRK
ncbi:hypothetical protein BKA56DRAFT_606458 [Ilyonectria sp. MPI-CAGE-AT-0026]|nr:hypothetical protein BKA56DRAFT_606458 [Ilyonectria sp. MPI-CAGE-AT-0026]